MTQAMVGERYQVVIPQRERKQLGLKPGTPVEITVENGCAVVRPGGAGTWRGIGRELSDGKPAVDYVRELREEWGRRT